MIILYTILAAILALFIYDVLQKKHAIMHNFPVIGHIRYLLEKIGPEMRQYLVANNREELPFSRRHRSWIYASSKNDNNLTGFGSDLDFDQPGHVIIKNKLIPVHSEKIGDLKCAKTIGTRRKKPYTPNSIVNISGMSFGALSAAAVKSLNMGAAQAGCFHNTGEGGLSIYHKNGADVVRTSFTPGEQSQKSKTRKC